MPLKRTDYDGGGGGKSLPPHYIIVLLLLILCSGLPNAFNLEEENSAASESEGEMSDFLHQQQQEEQEGGFSRGGQSAHAQKQQQVNEHDVLGLEEDRLNFDDSNLVGFIPGPNKEEVDSAPNLKPRAFPDLTENEIGNVGETQQDFLPINKKSQLTWYPPDASTDSDNMFSRKGRYFSANEYVKRHLCIPLAMGCNVRPNSCCPLTTCRCNLFGQNCRCLRMGIFQRWGRRK